MNTRNWQIKILTLCMAAIALCLTGACGDSFPGEEPVARRIMPADPCPNDINEVHRENPRLTTRGDTGPAVWPRPRTPGTKYRLSAFQQGGHWCTQWRLLSV